MYDLNSVLIAAILLASMTLAIELGYRVGFRKAAASNEAARTQVNAVQASLLGVLALLLGFTFSLALQRFDSRSDAVLDEANAIGTVYLRNELLPADVRADAKQLVAEYLDLRVEAGAVDLAHLAQRQALLAPSALVLDALWALAARVAISDPGPATTALFVVSLNEMMDAFARRDAQLNRHVPELVLFLLYGTFIMTGTILGYSAGVGGHRASFATYIMVGLIVMLVFIIIDLDRPRRGLIEVSQMSLLDLQAHVVSKTASATLR